jgi:nucleoid-associated protein YgaU
MTRENKVALVVGFALVLFVGILVSDHLSKAQTQRSANLAPVKNTSTTTAGPPARFVDLRTTLPPRSPRPVPINPQRNTAQRATSPVQAARVDQPVLATTMAVRVYEVRPGESLSTICQQTYGTATLTAALAAHNDISDPDSIRAGQRLRLPPTAVLTKGSDNPATTTMNDVVDTPAEWGAYRIKSGDSLSEIAREFMGSAGRWRQLYELNRNAISDPDNIRAGTVLRVPSG